MRGAAEPGDWLSPAREAYADGRYPRCARLLDRIDVQDEVTPPEVRREVRWLRRWVKRARAASRPAVPIEPGVVALGVLDFKQPDLRNTSGNIGDYIQTLAALGHLVRHPEVRFHGPERLTALATELQDGVPQSARRPGVRGDVRLVRVNRDASNLDVVPDGTWLIVNGWYMHSQFGTRWDFPLNPALRPIFVSFHLQYEQVLTPEVVDYLRLHAPIGCRDLHTQRLLRTRGIPAFFSGCLTTTIDLMFPKRTAPPSADAPIAYVDADIDASCADRAVQVRHTRIGMHPVGIDVAVRRARDMLAAYRTDFSRIVTSRLHCYLPTRSLGVDVEFRPLDPRDTRFAGLADLDDDRFAAMRASLVDKLETAMTSILRGDDEPAVRKTWTEICADDVAR